MWRSSHTFEACPAFPQVAQTMTGICSIPEILYLPRNDCKSKFAFTTFEEARMLGPYGKFIIALVGAAVVIVGRHFGETSWEYLDLTTLATALGVYATRNG